jgi:hypothetical protein
MAAARLAARLRAISGADEDWIASVAQTHAPSAAHELLARCLGMAGDGGDLDEVRALSLAERDWLLLQLHQRSFGADIAGEVRCPSCQGLNEIRFAARDLLEAPPAAADAVAVPLPSGGTAMVRRATAADHEFFWASAAHGTAAQQEAALSRLVVSSGDPASTGTDLGEADRREVAQALEASVPEPIALDLICQECGHRFDAPFDPAAFVVAEVLAHSRMLLNDVHTLARAYHWSERDILQLPIGRRLAYLDRIDADRTGALVQEAR